MDSGLDKNEPELRVLVLPVLLQVLADGDSLLDQHVKIFWNLRGEAYCFEENSLRQSMTKRRQYRIASRVSLLYHETLRFEESCYLSGS